MRSCTLVRICDECNYGSYQGQCTICGGPGVSDAYYCKECTIQEKDVSQHWVCVAIIQWFKYNNMRLFGWWGGSVVYSIMRDFTLIVLMCVLTNEFTLIEIISFLSCCSPLYLLFLILTF